MSQNSSALRNVLVAVSGQTPSIVTETLWALENRLSIRVDEIRVITTSLGQRTIMEHLLSPDGHFSRYCEDYKIPPGRISFSGINVHVLKDSAGEELEDIRTCADNANAADQVFNLIREWCARKDERLLCSVAGGRKTLGIYLAMSLMMCSRPADRLYHVLVSPEFETGVPDFFYPPPQTRFYLKSRTLGTCGGSALSEHISSEEAGVELAEIPFLRLVDGTGEGRLHLEKGFTNAVLETQLLMDYTRNPPRLTVSLETCCVHIGRIEVRLTRQLAAVYVFFLLSFNGPGAGNTIESLFEKRQMIADIERFIDKLRKAEMEVYAWEKILDLEDFRDKICPCISKVNKAIRKAVGNNLLALHYAVLTGRIYGVNVRDFRVMEKDNRKWERPA